MVIKGNIQCYNSLAFLPCCLSGQQPHSSGPLHPNLLPLKATDTAQSVDGAGYPVMYEVRALA